MNKFEKESNYTEKSNFTQIKFGHDTGILETELNELQQIQETFRTSMTRKMIPSGFHELVRSDFTGDAIIYNPTDNGLTLTNKIAIAPFKCYVNGYEIDARGNFTYNKLDDYILVDLGKASDTSTKDSLIYLEAWFEVVNGDSQVKSYGYNSGDTIGTTALDSRIGVETSRRIMLFWDIRVKSETDFDNYPEGLGYKTVLKYSSVVAKANGQFGSVTNCNIVFANAINELFEDELFNSDKNLYIAGRKDYETNSSTLYGKYAFALPMFRVRRRNSTQYSISNFNGAPSYNKMMIVNDSSINGDLLNNMRPDQLAYDVINVNDMIDLRKSISMNGFQNNSFADSTVQELFNGTLQTDSSAKMRRIQIGNSHMSHADIPFATIVIPFEKTTIQEIPAYDINNPLTTEINVDYEDSACGYGAVIKGHTQLSYDLKNSNITTQLINELSGTIDFYFKPFWNGCDETISQTIVWLGNESNSPIIKLSKQSNKLILSQFNYEENNDNYNENQAIVDLSEHLLIANQYYHIRISWTNENIPTCGQIFTYINGTLISQANYSKCYLSAYKLNIGSTENTSNTGFLIDELIGYSKNFEILSSNSELYGYTKNKFWPMLPQDFINSNTLLMPSFNSIINNYGDCAYLQKNTIQHLKYDKTLTLKTFYLIFNSDKYINSIENVYSLTGDIITGVWTGIGTNSAMFKPYDQTQTEVIVQCTIGLSSGCGGQDMPTEILAASITKYDDGDGNYNYSLINEEEVSFCDMLSQYPKEVKLLKPRKVSGNEDSAYDFPNYSRDKTQCYARLLYYNMSGDGTNSYKIPTTLYGYDVLGVVGCKNQKITKITKIPNTTVGEKDINFVVYLKDALLIGDTITFELALGGYSFDYDLESKTIMNELCQCKLLEFVADGVNSTYTLSCCKVSEEGYIHGGVLKSVFTFKDNTFDSSGNMLSDHPEIIQCYQDGQIFYDTDGKPTDQRIFNTLQCKIMSTSYGTPFITIVFNEDDKPRQGVIIQIPIMITYQHTANTLMSIWYNYIPYQGTMSSSLQTVSRINEWKYFITTLSSGKDNNAKIKQNIVNYLPGGLTYGYTIDNKDIILLSAANNMKTTLSSEDLNLKLVFLNGFLLKDNNEICNLIEKYNIIKNSSKFQDGNLTINNVDFNLYFDDCENAVNKYIGAFCEVITNSGEIMVFVIGNINVNSTIINKLNPNYGDLYKISGRPTTI